MQIRTMKLMLAVVGAMSLVLTGCPDGGRESLACTDTTQCIEGEICHPSAKVCVQTCTLATNECPDSAPKCEPIGGGNTQEICKCSTTALCQRDERVTDASTLECTSAGVCAPAGGTTTPACTKNADCTTSGQVCDVAAGVCKAACTKNADCTTSGQVCEVASGLCKAQTTGNACQGQGKSTCNYGEFCNTGTSTSGTCAVMPAPTCQNYTNFTQRDQLGVTGPMLFTASVVSAAVETTPLNQRWCQDTSAPKRVRVKLSAYANTPFPENKSALNGFLYVLVAGSQTSATALVSDTAADYVVSGTNKERADIIVNFCVAQDSTTRSLGFYFTNGNFLCYQANY
jgi:hypothetical protein